MADRIARQPWLMGSCAGAIEKAAALMREPLVDCADGR